MLADDSGRMTVDRNCCNQGVLTSVRRLFAFFEVNECNRDFSPTTDSALLCAYIELSLLTVPWHTATGLR